MTGGVYGGEKVSRMGLIDKYCTVECSGETKSCVCLSQLDTSALCH